MPATISSHAKEMLVCRFGVDTIPLMPYSCHDCRCRYRRSRHVSHFSNGRVMKILDAILSLSISLFSSDRVYGIRLSRRVSSKISVAIRFYVSLCCSLFSISARPRSIICRVYRPTTKTCSLFSFHFFDPHPYSICPLTLRQFLFPFFFIRYLAHLLTCNSAKIL